MIKKLSIFIVIFGLLIATGWAVIERQYVRDLYVVETSEQQPAAIAAVEPLGLTDEGLFLYKASQPRVQSSEEFNANCGNIPKEQSIVLGCYTRQRIFIFDVTDERLSGVEEVTAAHELLHAVYERLSPQERADLDSQLRAVADTITDERFQETLEAYRQSDPGQLSNEMHSILGTETAVLPQALENHYAQYFTDRTKVVSLAKQYQSQFDEIERQIEAFDAQLETYKSELDTIEQSLINKERALNTKQAELPRLQGSSVAAYNAQVPIFNTMVQEYNILVTEAKELTKSYNELVAQRNELAATQNDLTQKLDSNFEAR